MIDKPFPPAANQLLNRSWTATGIHQHIENQDFAHAGSYLAQIVQHFWQKVSHSLTSWWSGDTSHLQKEAMRRTIAQMQTEAFDKAFHRLLTNNDQKALISLIEERLSSPLLSEDEKVQEEEMIHQVIKRQVQTPVTPVVGPSQYVFAPVKTDGPSTALCVSGNEALYAGTNSANNQTLMLFSLTNSMAQKLLNQSTFLQGQMATPGKIVQLSCNQGSYDLYMTDGASPSSSVYHSRISNQAVTIPETRVLSNAPILTNAPFGVTLISGETAFGLTNTSYDLYRSTPAGIFSSPPTPLYQPVPTPSWFTIAADVDNTLRAYFSVGTSGIFETILYPNGTVGTTVQIAPGTNVTIGVPNTPLPDTQFRTYITQDATNTSSLLTYDSVNRVVTSTRTLSTEPLAPAAPKIANCGPLAPTINVYARGVVNKATGNMWEMHYDIVDASDSSNSITSGELTLPAVSSKNVPHMPIGCTSDGQQLSIMVVYTDSNSHSQYFNITAQLPAPVPSISVPSPTFPSPLFPSSDIPSPVIPSPDIPSSVIPSPDIPSSVNPSPDIASSSPSRFVPSPSFAPSLAPIPIPVPIPFPVPVAAPVDNSAPTIQVTIPENLNLTYVPVTANIVCVSNNTYTVELVDTNGYSVVFTANCSSVPLDTPFPATEIYNFSISRGNATTNALPVFEACSESGNCTKSPPETVLQATFTTNGIDLKIVLPLAIGIPSVAITVFFIVLCTVMRRNKKRNLALYSDQAERIEHSHARAQQALEIRAQQTLPPPKQEEFLEKYMKKLSLNEDNA